MTKQEWQEMMDETVNVNGVEKRLGDCSLDDVKVLQAQAHAQRNALATEINTMQVHRRYLEHGLF